MSERASVALCVCVPAICMFVCSLPVYVCASYCCQCVRAKDRQRRLKRTRLTVGADCDGDCDRATAATAKATAVLCVRRVKIRFACAVP